MSTTNDTSVATDTIEPPTNNKMDQMITGDEEATLRSKCVELQNMLSAIGFDGIPDENIPELDKAYKDLVQVDQKTRHVWAFITYVLNKNIELLCQKGRANHSLNQRVKRASLCDEIATTLKLIYLINIKFFRYCFV